VSDDPPVNKLLVVSEEVENGKLSSGEFLVVVWNELDKKSYPTSGCGWRDYCWIKYTSRTLSASCEPRIRNGEKV